MLQKEDFKKLPRYGAYPRADNSNGEGMINHWILGWPIFRLSHVRDLARDTRLGEQAINTAWGDFVTLTQISPSHLMAAFGTQNAASFSMLEHSCDNSQPNLGITSNSGRLHSSTRSRTAMYIYIYIHTSAIAGFYILSAIPLVILHFSPRNFAF